MKNKSLGKKIISIGAILISVFMVLLQVKFLVQNLQFLEMNFGEVKKPLAMYLKLGFTLGFGVIVMSLVFAFNLVNFESDKQKKDLLISMLVFLLINVILVLVFFNTEAKPFAKQFKVGSAEDNRSIAYYFYHIKKIFLIILGAIFIMYTSITDTLNKNDKVRQSKAYIVISVLSFVNIMFLMVTILDVFKGKGDVFDKHGNLVLAGVVFAVIAFFMAFSQIIVSFIQNRALSSDRLSHKKLKKASLSIATIETVLAIVVVGLFQGMFKLNIEAYLSFFFLEYLLLLITFSIKVILSLSFSIDERLFAERKERLEKDEELSENFLVV